ncbi:MAG TPA: hypothetical protein VL494_13675 [Steroidobacteraceae bacterium]|jgi:hypothetical protein|nr:hypothetical protein [Steroidobacteraceae bacterium]
MGAPKLSEVTQVRPPVPDVIAALEELLEQARAGEIISVGIAYEMSAGYSGHKAVFGPWANRPLLVGKLAVLQQHIVLSDCLEWKPD